MLNGMQIAIIKKDIGGITSNNRMFSVLLIVPLMMALFVPIIFIVTIIFSVDSSEIMQLAGMLTADTGSPEEMTYAAMDLLLNYIMPLFFLLIPVMAASVMAASAFVGEKEKNTLETLFYCPIKLKDIFIAKILAAFFLGMTVTLTSFVAMILVVEALLSLTMGITVMPGINWVILLLLVSPSISLIAICLIVRGSAKAQTTEESQQRSVFLVLPVFALAIGQFSGALLVNAWLLLGIGALLAAVAAVMLKSSYRKFKYEMLLM